MCLLWVPAVAIVWQIRPVSITSFSRLCYHFKILLLNSLFWALCSPEIFIYLLFRDFAFASENLSTQLVSGFQNKVPSPDFFRKVSDVKDPGHGRSGSDRHHQPTAHGEFDRTVKSDFTTAPNPTLFWRGPVPRIKISLGSA